MKKVALGFASLVTALGVQPVSAAPVGDVEACSAQETAVLVRVDGFKARQGMLRVQIYGSNPADFLAKGKKVRRIDVPVARSGRVEVCVDLPGPGSYAVAVRHDLDGNGKSGWNDGGGFSRNPKLSLVNLKPNYRDVVIQVGRGVRAVDVTLNYRRGLSIGPVAG